MGTGLCCCKAHKNSKRNTSKCKMSYAIYLKMCLLSWMAAPVGVAGRSSCSSKPVGSSPSVMFALFWCRWTDCWCLAPVTATCKMQGEPVSNWASQHPKTDVLAHWSHFRGASAEIWRDKWCSCCRRKERLVTYIRVASPSLEAIGKWICFYFPPPPAIICGNVLKKNCSKAKIAPHTDGKVQILMVLPTSVPFPLSQSLIVAISSHHQRGFLKNKIK